LPSHEPLETQNRWIWPFELLEHIGEGGMGEVYRARFVKNDRIVAVKLLPSDVTNETILARFEQEMKILRALRHPNIVHCFGGACEGDQQFYAMELVEGGALSDLLRKQGRLSVDRTIEYARQMCAALAYAHERGVVHRDVKPANFLLTPDGQLKLSDFGLATISAGRKITADDRTVGTFLYMAPEQITGKPPVSPQTDLYALGCVLFEMLAGSSPFQGNASGEVLHKHLTEAPPALSSLVMSCPAEIDQLVARLLAKKPEDRPASAAEVVAALNNCGSTITVVQRRPSLMTPTKQKEKPAPPPTEKPAVKDTQNKRALPDWLIAGCLLLVVALFVWNRSLAHRAVAFGRAETKLIDTFRDKNSFGRLVAASALSEFATESDWPSPL
jgi:eukaryotic-like serine/threonine-protein kinase